MNIIMKACDTVTDLWLTLVRLIKGRQPPVTSCTHHVIHVNRVNSRSHTVLGIIVIIIIIIIIIINTDIYLMI